MSLAYCTKIVQLALIFILLAFSGAHLPAFGQNAGSLDLGFNPNDTGFGNGNGTGSDNNGNGYGAEVNAMAIQPGGKTLVAGSFATYRNQPTGRLFRLLPNGELDPSFQLNLLTSGIAYTVKVQPDGKILVGGRLYLTGQQTPNSIYRLNADGSLDNSFNALLGPHEDVYTMALQPDGKIIVAGSFTEVQGVSRKNIARLHTNGSLDYSFDPGVGFDLQVNDLAVAQNGNILVGGHFQQYNNLARPYLVCLNQNGNIDQNFTPAFNGPVQEIEIDLYNRILVGGYFTTLNGDSCKHLARLHPGGTPDPSFLTGTGLESISAFGPNVYDIHTRPDGSILVAGIFTRYNLQDVNSLLVLQENGNLYPNYIAMPTNSGLYCLAPQADGSILIGGSGYFYLNGLLRMGISKLDPDGTLDLDFPAGTGLNYSVNVIEPQPDGKILVGGMFDLYYNHISRGLVRLNSDGSIDPDFLYNLDFDTEVDDIFLLPNGSIIISGQINQNHDNSGNTIARLLPNGLVDSTFHFDYNLYGLTYARAVQADGKLIAVRYTGQNSFGYLTELIRINIDGSIDSTFQSSQYEGQIRAAVVQATGKIIIGGEFNDQPDLKRLHTDGTVDNTFWQNMGANGSVSDINCLALQPDGKILTDGSVANTQTTLRKWISRFNPDGSLDLSFNTGATSTFGVWDIEVQPNGQILIASDYYGNGGFNSQGVCRLNADGTGDGGFQSGLGQYEGVFSVAAVPIDRILIGGDFISYNGVGKNRLARLNGSAGGNKLIKSYPVPFTDKLEVLIQDGGNQPAHVSLINLQGKIIESRVVDLEVGKFSLPISRNIDKGIYILRVQLSSTIHSMRVAKN